MAMSDTMSGPNDWLHFYQQNLPGQVLPSSVSEATTVTTTTSSPLGSGTHTHLSPEGRVSKPIRRRSRSSRRTPTTLLNTDTTNFRAMVQQFTGGPTAPFAPTASPFPNMGFGFGSRPSLPLNPNGLISAFHLQNQQQQQLYHHHQNYIYGTNTSTESGDNNTFVQAPTNPTPTPTPTPTPPHVSSDLFMDHHGGRFFPSSSS